MRKTLMFFPTREEYHEDWITELKQYGVHHDANGTPVEELDYHGVRQLLVVTQMRQGTGRNVESKENVWF